MYTSGFTSLVYALYELRINFMRKTTEHSVHSILFFIWPVTLPIFLVYRITKYMLSRFNDEKSFDETLAKLKPNDPYYKLRKFFIIHSDE